MPQEVKNVYEGEINTARQLNEPRVALWFSLSANDCTVKPVREVDGVLLRVCL